MLHSFYSLNMGGPADRQTLWATLYLTSLHSLATIISVVSLDSLCIILVYCYCIQAYIFVGDPVFHHIAYGVIVVAITFQAFYNLK